MAEQRLMQAIGRIERSLARLEQVDFTANSSAPDHDLQQRHASLKAAAQSAVDEIDKLLAKAGN
jgi:hypothetical protein